ncbi:polymorphic toxin-type HINT domain-containing protein [Actinoalloteichus caeruleus]|uniref:polymorphic toxin-type HINT domain-containing protein n=1 Tax=Actinoalloteichus cyanogriseus TaxID=2893586 RepID=UPI003555D998
MPWTKLGKIPDLLRGINRAVDRVRTWRRERDEATAVLRSAGCRVNSFVPGTLVLLADGTHTPIEDIQLGDEVLASDPDTGEIGPQRVVATITSEGPKTLVDVSHTPSPDQLPGTVTATDEHPFWVDDHGRWTHATDLTRGDTLLTPTGDHTTITHAHTYPHHHRVHNLTINAVHTYYVLAGETPVLVHNCGGGVTGHPASCECADGGIPKVRNGKLAGDVHPKTNVPFDENGFPDFSAWRHPDVPDVRIELSGSRGTDFARSNRAAGLSETDIRGTTTKSRGLCS